MSTKNKSIASQALLEMDAITSAIKEESKKSLNTLLSEAVKKALRESCNEEDDDYEVQDGDDENENENTSDNKEESPKKSENEIGNPEMNGGDESGNDEMNQPQGAEPEMGGQEAGAEEVPGAEQAGAEPDMSQDGAEGSGNEAGWDEFSDYQVGDSNTYDLTGENDYDTVVKVYKLLNDEDQVVVKKDGDTLQLQDNNAGTEYIIDLGGDDEQPTDDMNGEEMPEGMNESLDLDGVVETSPEDFEDDETFEDSEMAGFPDGEGDSNFDDVEFGDYEGWEDDAYPGELGFDDVNDEDLDGFEQGSEFLDNDNELMEGKKMKTNKNTRKPMKESKGNVLFEVDLGYTDNYQDKDPIAGLSNNEPSKGGKSWHKGVPTGTKKPWAGETKSKGDPFKDTQKVQGSVNEEDINPTDVMNAGAGEMEEQKNVGGFVQQNSVTASNIPNSNGRKARSQRGTDVKVTGSADPRYSSATNESKELKAIKNENKELKKAILELRKSLNEAYITNVNLGKITKLFLENATSKEEKIDIVNRFSNEAKTVEQSKALYESIDKQLKRKEQIALNETSATANGTKELNEQKIYKSNDLMKTIDLMGRVLNC